MEIFDVAIVGGGPAGSSCAAFCALACLRTLVLEREKFPREKVCGDCLNPSCWPVLERLGVAQRVRDLPHSKLAAVEFIGIDGRKVIVDLPSGYSGQAPVNETELNLCLVGAPPTISRLRQWAERHFEVPADQPWRTITPLTRLPVPCAHENLLFIGDAARVVEPFTGEGIYYALRSGELAAQAIIKMLRGEDRQSTLRDFARTCAEMYRGRLWINRLARASVLSPRLGWFFVHAARIDPSILRLLTAKIVKSN